MKYSERSAPLSFRTQRSEVRNLKSITARPDSQCRASIVTKSENSGRIYVGIASLDSSTPLYSAQNDRAGGALSSMESGATVNTPVSPSRPRWRIPSLLRFDRQEHMYHTKYKRSPTAKSSQNEEMEQNGTKWNKNKEKSLWAGPHPCPSCIPSITRLTPPNFTITRMQQNATPCNKFTKNTRTSPTNLTPSPGSATVVARVPPGPPGSVICSLTSTRHRCRSRPCYNRT